MSTTLTLKKVFRHCRWADEFIRRWLSRVFFFWIDERFIARCNVFVASDHSKPLLFYPFSLLILWIVHGKMVKCHLWTDRHLSERFQFVTVFPTVSLCCRGLISLVLHTVLICWDLLWICVSHDVWRFIEILLHKAKLSLYSCLLCIKVYGMLDQFAHLYYKATKPFRCEMLRLDLDSPLAPFVSVYLRISVWAHELSSTNISCPSFSQWCHTFGFHFAALRSVRSSPFIICACFLVFTRLFNNSTVWGCTLFFFCQRVVMSLNIICYCLPKKTKLWYDCIGSWCWTDSWDVLWNITVESDGSFQIYKYFAIAEPTAHSWPINSWVFSKQDCWIV